MVAGNMAVSMDVRTGGVICDMQKVLNTKGLHPGLAVVSVFLLQAHP